MLNTDDLSSIEFIKKKVGLKILPRLTDNDSIKSALLLYQKSLKAEFGDLIQQDALSLKALTENSAETGAGDDGDLKRWPRKCRSFA